MNLRYLSVFIGYIILACYKISTHQTYFISREQTEIFTRRLDHKVVSLDVKFSGKWHFSCTHLRIFLIVWYIQIFYLAFRIIGDHQFDRIQDRHHTRLRHLQIFTDTIFKHRIIYRTIALWYTGKFHKLTDGWSRKSTAAKCCDGDKTRIIPSVYHAIFYQFLNISFSGNYIGQIHLCKFDLPRRYFKFTLAYNPVIQWAVVLKFQCTDGMTDSFYRILDRMRKVVHRINAPFVARIMVHNVCHTIQDWITHIDIWRTHINFRTENFFAIFKFSIFHFGK